MLHCEYCDYRDSGLLYVFQINFVIWQLLFFVDSIMLYLCLISLPFLIAIYNTYSIITYIIGTVSQLGSVESECSVLGV